MKCSIGVFLKRKCASKKLRKSKQFSSREWTLLMVRSGVPNFKSVCDDHADQFGRLYSVSQKICCNPLNLHKKIISKGLKTVSASFHDKFNRINPEVIEGRKLCVSCRLAVQKLTAESAGEKCLRKTGNKCFIIVIIFTSNFVCFYYNRRSSEQLQLW